MADILRHIMTAGHPYRRSPNRHIYEEMAETFGCSPDRIYQLAHGSTPKNFTEESILADLLRRGIIHRR